MAWPRLFALSQALTLNDAYRERVAESEAEIGKVLQANCWCHVPTEDLWGCLGVGRLYVNTFATRRDATDEVIDWFTFYNQRRLHATLGYLSPTQFEKIWRAAQQDNAAQSSGYGVRPTGARSAFPVPAESAH